MVMRSFRVVMKCVTEGCDNEIMMMSIHGWCKECYEKWVEGYAAAYSKKTYSWEGEEE